MINDKTKLESMIVCGLMLFLFFQLAPQENASAGLTEEWTAFYEGPIEGPDLADVIIVDDAGNVYVAGYSWNGGACGGGSCNGPYYDFLTVMYNEDGVEQWSARFNGPTNCYDILEDMARDPNTGNVYVSGSTSTDPLMSYGALDYQIVAYSATGAELWNRTFDGTANDNDSAYAMAVDPSSGNLYVTGRSSNGWATDYEYVTLAYSSTGTKLWEARRYSDNFLHFYDDYVDITVGPSGTVYFTGTLDGDYIITIAYDPLTGSELWNATLDPHHAFSDHPSAIVVDPNTENIYVSATHTLGGDDSNYITIAYDSSGNELWTVSYDGPANGEDEATDIALDSAGNVYVTGFSMGLTSGSDYATVSYDSSGNERWVSRYNGPGNVFDQANAITYDGFGNVYVTGQCCGNFATPDDLGDIANVGYNSTTGAETFSDVIVGTADKRDLGNDITADQNGNVYMTGYYEKVLTYEDYITVKYSSSIVPPVPPTAIAGPDQLISENEMVQLDGTGSFDSDGSIVSYSWDLDVNHDSSGDGIQDNDVDASGPTPSVTLWNDDHISTVKLTVTDNDGATDSDTLIVTIQNLGPTGDFNIAHDPVQGFVYDWTAGDPGSDDLTVTLEIGPLTPITEVYFNDGAASDPDPSPYAGTAPFGIVDSGLEASSLPPGVYECNLTVSDDDGGTYLTSKLVSVVNTPPVADYSNTPMNPIKDETIQFTDNSTDTDGPVVMWEWEFGDGSTSTLQNPMHSFATIDTFTVTLTVWDEHDANDSISKSITVVNLPPDADFSYTPLNPRVDELITFSDESTDSDGSVVRWEWDFGDGFTSTQENPAHSYSTIDTFSVTLTVWDDLDDSDSITKSIAIGNLAPSAGFSYLPVDPKVDAIVTFVDESSDPDGSVVAWSWDFGDGTTSNEQNPTHSYSGAGSNLVTLTVFDNDGGSNTTSKTVVVVENQKPVAEFSYTPDNPNVGEPVTFKDRSSDPDGSIAAWDWNFGDGTTSSEMNHNHIYMSPGTYTITLKVYDDSGEFSIIIKEITVEPNEVVPDEVYHFPWWLLVLIVAVILFLILFIILWRRRKKKEEEMVEKAQMK
jgi:PKD repeat protein